MDLACPKCASTAVRPLGIADMAPPGKRWWRPWALLAAECGLIALAGRDRLEAVMTPALAAAVVATWLALRAWRYNTMRLPKLLRRWEQSFMCDRCGEVFVGI